MTKAKNAVKRGWTQEALFTIGPPVPAPATPIANGERITKPMRVKRIAALAEMGFAFVPHEDGSDVEVLVRCYRCKPAFQWTSRLTDHAMRWFEEHAEGHK